MNRQRLIRGLRIAWSVGFGILCLLVIALWVRSYWWLDYVGAQLGSSTTVYAASADAITYWAMSSSGSLPNQSNWQYGNMYRTSYNASELEAGLKAYINWRGRWGFGSSHIPDAWVVSFPYWFVLLVTGVLAYVPWFPWSPRFSLRTLLIVTTLIAIALGLGVYLARR